MTRVYKIMERRSPHNPETRETSTVDGVHLDIACVARRMQWILAHTCMHEGEPVFSDDCVEHIAEEIQDLINHIKELGGSLGHLDCCAVMRKKASHKEVHKYLDHIADELDGLHENIRKFVVDSQDRTHDYGHHVYGGVAQMRSVVCERVKKLYHEFLVKMHDHGLIDRDLHIDLQLS